jgi:hypothetical protein
MNDVAQTLKALGNLSSEVMPMRILAEQDGAAPPTALLRPVSAQPPSGGLPAMVPDAVPRARSDADTSPRSDHRSPPPAPASTPPSLAVAAPAPISESESTVPARDPPTIPMRSADLLAALSSTPTGAERRAAPPPPSSSLPPSPASGAAARRPLPARAPLRAEDSTELMTEGRIPAVPRASGEIPLLDGAETAPIMRLRDLKESEDAYLERRRQQQLGPWQSLLQAAGWLVDFMLGRKTAARTDRHRLDPATADAARRRGALLFAALVFIGVLLGLMILFAS